MSSRERPFYITTPIYYVNDRPHIGHTYTTVVTDVLARYHRMLGHEVRFLTGTDEHGQKLERAAAKLGITPKELCDRNAERFRDLWRTFDITQDDFIRTTEARHRRGVELLFRTIRDKDDIYLGKYSGYYCTGCEATYPESQVKDGVCPDQGHPVEKIEEPSYFFRLSKYQEPLLQLYRERPEFVRPESRLNEVVSFVESGLRDLSISRTTFRWGIPVPDDPQHVIYVWFDALSNYITALGYGGATADYDRFWPAIHVVGKDILRFHAVYWPAFLLSAGLPVPECILGHGWWLRDDAKMSKSFGNVVRPEPLVETFGVDAVRYFLLRDMSFGMDASYSDEALVDRINSDLANDLGNLTSRLLTMLDRYRDGSLPGPGTPGEAEEALRASAEKAVEGYRRHFDAYRFDRGLASLWELIGELNRYLVRQEPWKLAADEAAAGRLDTVLHHAAQGLAVAAACLAPVMPSKARELWESLGGRGDPAATRLDGLLWSLLPPGGKVRRGESLFPRIDKKAYFASTEETNMEERPAEEKKPAPAPAPEPEAKAEDGRISIDDFMKVDLRVAKVIVAEKIENADKLLRLEVDLGNGEKRQIVAGVAQKYTPEDLLGRTIVVVANLKPAKLRGVESQGMLLAADAGGVPIVASFEESVEPGTRVR